MTSQNTDKLTICVDYGLTLDEMIAKVKWKQRDPDFCGEYFPEGKKTCPEEVTYEVEVVSLFQPNSHWEERMSRTPATIDQGVVFAYTYPGIILDSPLLLIGSRLQFGQRESHKLFFPAIVQCAGSSLPNQTFLEKFSGTESILIVREISRRTYVPERSHEEVAAKQKKWHGLLRWPFSPLK